MGRFVPERGPTDSGGRGILTCGVQGASATVFLHHVQDVCSSSDSDETPAAPAEPQ